VSELVTHKHLTSLFLDPCFHVHPVGLWVRDSWRPVSRRNTHVITHTSLNT